MESAYSLHTSEPGRSGPDERAAEWLERAKAGDSEAREALLGWAYGTAYAYYRSKLEVENGLTAGDAHDLAGAFVEAFHGAWPRVCAVRNYTRRMLRNNLNRYLQQKRLVRRRETPLACEAEGLYAASFVHRPEDCPDDGDELWRMQAAVRRSLQRSDECTRTLILLRVGSDQPSYRELAQRLGLSESALRMRATRFYRMVRAEHERLLGAAEGRPRGSGTRAA